MPLDKPIRKGTRLAAIEKIIERHKGPTHMYAIMKDLGFSEKNKDYYKIFLIINNSLNAYSNKEKHFIKTDKFTYDIFKKSKGAINSKRYDKKPLYQRMVELLKKNGKPISLTEISNKLGCTTIKARNNYKYGAMLFSSKNNICLKNRDKRAMTWKETIIHILKKNGKPMSIIDISKKTGKSISFLRVLLSAEKNIIRVKKGTYGLKNRDKIVEDTISAMIFKILKKNGKPMHISEFEKHKNVINSKSKHFINSVSSAFHVKRNLFVRVALGTYGLVGRDKPYKKKRLVV